MSKRSSYTTILFSFCWYDIATSFFTTTTSTNSFMHNTARYSDHHRNFQPIHSMKRSILTQQAPISSETRSRLFLISPDLEEFEFRKINTIDGESDQKDGVKVNDNEQKPVTSSDESCTVVTGFNKDATVGFSEDGLGRFDPSKKIRVKREVIVGDPQLKLKKEEKSVAEILTELAAIQKQGPQKYCILGSRHISFLHQQIIELL